MENKQKYGLFVKINDAEGIMAISESETFDMSFRATTSEFPSLKYNAPNGETVSLVYRAITEKEAEEGLADIRIVDIEPETNYALMA